MPPEIHPKKTRLEHFKQSESRCGPASLKILTSHFGKHFTEEELAKLAGTTFERGTSHTGMIKAAKEIGGHVFAKEGGTIKELEYFVEKEGLPVIVGWFHEDTDHFSVVASVTDQHVVIVDPAEDKPESWIDRDLFPKIWFDFVGTNRRVASWGWYMVVTFEKREFEIEGGKYY